MAGQSGRIRVGIGGWVFEPWRETFYPAGLPKSEELAFASRQVTTIEINATYYRTQSPDSFRRWAATAPDDFVFSVKANRFTTNRKNLAEGREAVTRFLESGLTELGPKLGPLLWQFAPTKKFNQEEIELFFASLPAGQDGLRLRHVAEVRHPSFVTPDFVALARRYNIAICLAVSDDYPLIADPTADFCYLRLQTTREDRPEGYDAPVIATWAKHARSLASGGVAEGLPHFAGPPSPMPRDCFVYMISGAKALNPAAARALIGALEG